MSEVVFVGTSDAFGSGGRRQSAYLLRAPSGGVLLDCGTTTGTGLSALGIEREEIDAIALSHFHADHFGGIPLFLLGALYQERRRKPLLVAGPPGTESRVRAMARAIGHPIEAQSWSFPIRFLDLPPGKTSEVGPVQVRTFETRHSPEACPHGLELRAGKRRLVYSGDTGWFEGLPEHARGADLFLCECTLLRKSYEYHLSLEELGPRRADFACERMILTHLGAEMRERGEAPGFELADDGRIVPL